MLNFAIRKKFSQGKVLEWLKRHAWKACNRRNRFVGSNPILSAENRNPQKAGFFFYCPPIRAFLNLYCCGIQDLCLFLPMKK